MSRLRRVALPRRRARLLAPDPWPRAVPGAASPIPSYLGSECEIILRICSFPGGFTRPTGDLGLQLYRRTDHVETRSPPYVCAPIVAACCEIREIAEDELPATRGRVARPRCRARTPAAISGFVDWRRQAGGDGLDARGAWTTRRSAPATRSPAGTRRRTARSAPRSSAGPPRRRHRDRDVLDALEGWAGDHGATELEGPVERGRRGQPRLGRRPRLRRRSVATRGSCST